MRCAAMTGAAQHGSYEQLRPNWRWRRRWSSEHISADPTGHHSAYARQLYLTTVADQFANLAEEAVRKKQSHLSYLEALLETETEERDRRAVIRRIKEAHFRRSRHWRSSIFRSAADLRGPDKKLSEASIWSARNQSF